jgi:hypothetical protein
MGSVPWAYKMCQYTCRDWTCRACNNEFAHLHVLLGSLLPLLGHGARPNGASEHAGEGEGSESTGNDGGGDKEDLTALIRRRGTAGAVGTEGNEVGCISRYMSAQVLIDDVRCGVGGRAATGQLGYTLIDPGYVMRPSVKLNGSAGGFYAPAFFSCMVSSFQSVFMRSLSDIQRSACS